MTSRGESSGAAATLPDYRLSSSERLLCHAAGWVLPALAIGYGLRKREFLPSLKRRLGGSERKNETAGVRPPLWIHAASVGEVRGISPLLRCLVGDNNLYLLVTTTSLTGQDEVERQFPGLERRLLPLDHPWSVRREFSALRPQAIVVAETEIWPNLFAEASARRVPLCMVNARISDRSFPRYRKFKRFFGPLLRLVSITCAQTAADRDRLVTIGADPERVIVTGSTKYDNEPKRWDEFAKQEFYRSAGFEGAPPVFVAGSVRETEDAAVLDAFLSAKSEFSNLKLVIAPRHPERFDVVTELVERRGLAVHRRSRGPAAGPADVLVLDTVGELSAVYGVGTIAFVGGTLVPIGGHNPLEPAAHGVPVIMGRSCENVRDVAAELAGAGGLALVDSGQALSDVLRKWLSDEDARGAAGRHAQAVWQGHRGATARTLAALRPYVGLEE